MQRRQVELARTPPFPDWRSARLSSPRLFDEPSFSPKFRSSFGEGSHQIDRFLIGTTSKRQLAPDEAGLVEKNRPTFEVYFSGHPVLTLVLANRRAWNRGSQCRCRASQQWRRRTPAETCACCEPNGALRGGQYQYSTSNSTSWPVSKASPARSSARSTARERDIPIASTSPSQKPVHSPSLSVTSKLGHRTASAPGYATPPAANS